MIPCLPISTPFPYTTLFRSVVVAVLSFGGTAPQFFAVTQGIILLLGILELAVMRRRTATSVRSEEHTSELQSLTNLVCRLLLEKKKNNDSRTKSIIRKQPTD